MTCWLQPGTRQITIKKRKPTARPLHDFFATSKSAQRVERRKMGFSGPARTLGEQNARPSPAAAWSVLKAKGPYSLPQIPSRTDGATAPPHRLVGPRRRAAMPPIVISNGCYKYQSFRHFGGRGTRHSCGSEIFPLASTAKIIPSPLKCRCATIGAGAGS